MKKTTLVSGSVSILALTSALGAPVFAQPTTTPVVTEEIVVTAQKREERLQDVPISIAVVSGAELDRSTALGISEILSRIPGVTSIAGGAGGGAAVAIRGASAAGPQFAGASTVGYYLDSVPFGLTKSAVVPDSDAYDMERIEVLRGPQGTLYGASALNGVVRVLTKDADPSGFEFKARGSLSSTRYGGTNYRGDAAVNLPIIEDKVAVRGVVGYEDLSGWIDRPVGHDANDSQRANYRLKVGMRPTDNLKIDLSAWLSRADFGAPSYSNDGLTSPKLLPEPITADYDTFGLTWQYQFDWASLTSATGYLDYSTRGFLDAAYIFLQPITLQSDFESQVLSQEVNLNSAGLESWRWSVGGLYRHAKSHLFQFRRNRIAPIDFSETSDSFAVYGELTRLLMDGKVELTGGLRYFKDTVDGRENTKQDGSTRPLILTTSKFPATTPRVAVTWHAAEDLTVYASYSQGFRSGSDQSAAVLAVAPQFGPVSADRLTNYETGLKGSFLDNRLTFDAALYYIDWKDIQQLLTVRTQGANVSAIVNAESASGIGTDISITARPADGLSLGASFGWNDLKLNSDVLSGGVALYNKGDRLNTSAEYTVAAFGDYTFPIGSDFDGRLALSANYTSKLDSHAVTGTTAAIFSGNGLLVGRASASVIAQDRWTMSLYVENFTNEQGIVTLGGVLNNVTNPDTALRIRPRTIGAQVEVQF